MKIPFSMSLGILDFLNLVIHRPFVKYVIYYVQIVINYVKTTHWGHVNEQC